MELRFTDGTTTVRILPSGGEAVLKRWTPQTPEVDTVDVAGALSDGGERPVVAYRNVTEQMDVVWAGAASEQRQRLNTLNRLFEGARHRQRTGVGPRVYVEFRASDAEDWWRSEVLSGRVLVDDGDLDFDLQLVTAGLEGAIIYTRRYYWEGPEAGIPLSNAHGTNVTNGLTVYNQAPAAGEDNHADIAAGVIAGDVPAPPRIELTNSYDGAAMLSRVFVAHNVYSSPATLPHMIEGEDGDGTTTSVVYAGGHSGGAYLLAEWSGESETEIAAWPLSAALLEACGGNYAHVMLRLYTTLAVSGVWVRLRLKVGLAVQWDGPLMELANGQTLQDLGVVQLPPYQLGPGDLYPLSLALCARTWGAGAHEMGIDYIQLAPADGWRVLAPVTGGVDETERLVDDMIAGVLYKDGMAVEGRASTYAAFGAPLALVPGAAQRLYFLQRAVGGGCEVARTLSVKAFYRPRRLTI